MRTRDLRIKKVAQLCYVRDTHLVLSTERALSRLSCQSAWRKASAALCRRGGHQYFPCCLESNNSNTTDKQLHAPRENSYTQRDKTRQSHTAQTQSASHTKSMSNCIPYVTFAPSLPSLASRLRKSSMSPGCVSTATVRNSSMVTLIRMSSVLLCSRVKNASLMAAASLPRQAYTDMGATCTQHTQSTNTW